MKILSACVCLLSLFLFGCGQPSESTEDAVGTSEPVGTVEAANPVTVDEYGVTVQMTGNDRMKFDVEAFSVKTGATVRFVFKNVGKMPKAAMGHNVVFLNQGVDEKDFATRASKARDNEYIPEGSDAEILAYTKLLGPGEVDEIEFVAPAPGEYPYICSFPAHMYAGMRGIMTVTE